MVAKTLFTITKDPGRFATKEGVTDLAKDGPLALPPAGRRPGSTTQSQPAQNAAPRAASKQKTERTMLFSSRVPSKGRPGAHIQPLLLPAACRPPSPSASGCALVRGEGFPKKEAPLSRGSSSTIAPESVPTSPVSTFTLPSSSLGCVSTSLSIEMPSSGESWSHESSIAAAREVFSSCGNMPWHCVYPDAEGHRVQSGGAFRPGSCATSIPSGCRAIVLIVSVPDNEAAFQLLKDIVEQGSGLPMVVVFVGLLKIHTDGDVVWDEYEKYYAYGVDEVIFGAEQCTKLAIEMSLHRADQQTKIADELENSKHTVQSLSRKVEAMQNSLDTLVFPQAHLIFPDLPPMRNAISGPPHANKKLDTITLRNQLGEGSYGSVWAAKDHRSGDHRALKAMSKKSMVDVKRMEGLVNEIRLLRRVQGQEAIVGFFGVIHGKDFFYLVMEHVAGINLFFKLKASGTLPPDVVRSYSRQIANGLAVCLDNDVAHRDLKPENVVVDEISRSVTIVDFGCAVCLGSGDLHTGSYGTMPFMAPEVMCGGAYDSSKVDPWAWAVVALEMMIGLGTYSHALGWPLKARYCKERAEDLKSCFDQPGFIERKLLPYAPVEEPYMDLMVKALEGALTFNPRQRWSAREIADCGWLKQA